AGLDASLASRCPPVAAARSRRPPGRRPGAADHPRPEAAADVADARQGAGRLLGRARVARPARGGRRRDRPGARRAARRLGRLCGELPDAGVAPRSRIRGRRRTARADTNARALSEDRAACDVRRLPREPATLATQQPPPPSPATRWGDRPAPG